MFIFSTPVLIRHLWQFKTVVFLHWCLMHALLFKNNNYYHGLLLNSLHLKDLSFEQMPLHKKFYHQGNIDSCYCKCVSNNLFLQNSSKFSQKIFSQKKREKKLSQKLDKNRISKKGHFCPPPPHFFRTLPFNLTPKFIP